MWALLKTMIPTGKGMFIWQVPRIGTPEQIAEQAKAAGFKHICIKIANGTEPYPPLNDNVGLVVAALQNAGILVFGWQYVYLYRPIEEAIIGAKRAIDLHCDGFIIDAERECKNKPAEAALYCNELIKRLPDGYPIGLSSYRYPSLHPELPWKVFRAICDFDMPQVYWERAHNPAEQLYKSETEFSLMLPELPYIPTGAAYKTNYTIDGVTYTWKSTPDDVAEFMATCEALDLPGFNFWEWYCAQTDLPDLWTVIADDEFMPDPDPTPAPDIVRVTSTIGLYIRNAPNGAKLGAAYPGSIWYVMRRVTVDGKEWLQVGDNAFMAGWYTVRV